MTNRPRKCSHFRLIRSLICLGCLAASNLSVADPNPPTSKCHQQEPALSLLWTIPDLKNPESVVLANDRETLYVSMVDGEADAVDGQGQIARIKRSGTRVDADWVSGLNAPKGLALSGHRLFASDITDLVEIDTRAGKVSKRYPIPGAKFLNDIAIAPDSTRWAGDVLISDSARGRIDVWHDGEVSEWLVADELRSINGLLPTADRLLVSTMQGLLLSISWEDRSITVLARDLGDGDGLAELGADRFLVSEWPGQLFLVAPGQPNRVLLDTRAEKRLLNDFLLLGDHPQAAPVLIVPHLLPGALSAYQLNCEAKK